MLNTSLTPPPGRARGGTSTKHSQAPHTARTTQQGWWDPQARQGWTAHCSPCPRRSSGGASHGAGRKCGVSLWKQPRPRAPQPGETLSSKPPLCSQASPPCSAPRRGNSSFFITSPESCSSSNTHQNKFKYLKPCTNRFLTNMDV